MENELNTPQRRRHEPLWLVLIYRRIPKSPAQRMDRPNATAEIVLARRWDRRLKEIANEKL